MKVGRLVTSWNGIFWVAILVSQSVFGFWGVLLRWCKRSGALKWAYWFWPQTVEVQDWMPYIPNTQQVFWKTVVRGSTVYHQIDRKWTQSAANYYNYIYYHKIDFYLGVALCNYGNRKESLCSFWWNFSPSDNSSSNDARKGEYQLKEREDQTQVGIALSTSAMQFVPNKNSPTPIDPIIYQPWFLVLLLVGIVCPNYPRLVDVAFGGCLWSLAAGLGPFFQLERISLIWQTYLEPYMVQFNGTTVEDFKFSKGFPHIFTIQSQKHPSKSSRQGAIPMALKSDFSGSGFAMVRSISREQTHPCFNLNKAINSCRWSLFFHINLRQHVRFMNPNHT